MTVKFTNNASTTVATGINSSATSLTVASASAFPQLAGADDYCYLTIQQSTGTVREVVKATALSSNTFTIVRAQDNTSAGTWSAGDIVELRMTAALLTDVIDAATVEGVKTNFQYTPTAGQTVFSGADNASNTLIINQAALVSVYMNGVRLVQGTDYSVSSANNTVTLTVGATTADIIDIEVFGNFTGQSGAAVAITGGAISGTSVAATTLSASGTATLNTFVSNNSTISGGTINNVNIGATTAGTGRFSSVTTTGSVGINNANPTSYFNNANDLVVGGATGSNGITISGDGDTQIFFADGTSGDTAYRGVIRYVHTGGSDQFEFKTAGANDALILDSSQDATFAGNVGIGAAPSSFDFEINRATASATALINSGNNDAMLRLYTSNNVGKWRMIARTDDTLSFENLNSGATAFDNRLKIDSSGNPTFQGNNHTNLQVKSGDDSVVAFLQTVQGSDARFGTSTNHPVNFAQNGAFRLVLDTNGNTRINGLLGVNKGVNTAVALSVGADSTTTSSYGLEVTNASANTRFLVNGLGDAFFYRTDNAVGMKFDASTGHVGIGAAPDTTGFGGTFKYLGVNGGSGYGVFNGQTTSTTQNDAAVSFFGSTTGSSGYKLLGGMQVVNGASSSSNAEGDLVFYTASNGSLGERMRIDRSGATTFKGNVKASDIIAKDSGGLSFQTDEGSKRLTIQDNGTLRFFTGVSYSDMYMYAQTNVLGNGQITMQPVTTPGSGTSDQYLHLASTAASGARTRMNLRVDGFLQCGYNVDSAYALQISNGTYVWLVGTAGNTFNFYGASGVRYGHISTSNGGTFVNGSDRALKENIVDLEYGLKEVKEIQSRRYDIKETGDTAIGFVAQELKEVVPEIVEGEEGSMGVAYANLVPVLVKAIQEQQDLIESLTARVAELENN